MISRWMEQSLTSAMKVRRGVYLTGARQVGKSTLADMLCLDSVKRWTMDDRQARSAATGDPMGFVTRTGGEALVIDEVQKVPELLDAIKMELDRNMEPGQYLLTGSSNIRFAKQVKDSLAGRLRTLRLRTLTLGEINASSPTFIEHAFARQFESEYPPLDKRDVIHLACQGGYPECREYEVKGRRDWFRDYLKDILTKDIQDITEIRKLSVIRSLALWLITRSAQFVAVDEASTQLGTSRVTIENYISALEALYLFDRVPAWVNSDYMLMQKRPKWFVTDSGLIANVLGWNEEDIYLDDSKNGKLVETWVYQQLAAMADVDGSFSISQYRDGKKREIDFVIECDDGSTLGVEVKAGMASQGDFRHLKWFGEHLAKGRFTGVVLYSGNRTLRFGDGYYAVPLSAVGV